MFFGCTLDPREIFEGTWLQPSEGTFGSTTQSWGHPKMNIVLLKYKKTTFFLGSFKIYCCCCFLFTSFLGGRRSPSWPCGIFQMGGGASTNDEKTHDQHGEPTYHPLAPSCQPGVFVKSDGFSSQEVHSKSFFFTHTPKRNEFVP